MPPDFPALIGRYSAAGPVLLLQQADLNMHLRILLIPLFWLPIASTLAGEEPAPSDPSFLVEPALGEPFEARLRAIGPDGDFRFVESSGTERVVEIKDLFKLGRLNPPPSTSPPREGLLLLAGGDRLSTRLDHFDETSAHVRGEALGPLQIPLDFVVGFVSGQNLDRSALNALARDVLQTPRESDLTWLANGDRLAGTIVRVEPATLMVEQDQAETNLGRDQVQAIALDPALIATPRLEAPALELYLSDHSRITGVPVNLVEGVLRLRTGFNVELECPIDQVVLAYVVGGSANFLTESELAGAEYVEYIGPVLPYQAGRSALGGPLQVDGVVYERGLGTQSRTLLAYRLDGTATRFQARIALDDSAGPWASVGFKILLDGKPAYDSPLMKAGDKPILVDLPLHQARFLILATEFGSNGNVQDYADWIEARLVK